MLKSKMVKAIILAAAGVVASSSFAANTMLGRYWYLTPAGSAGPVRYAFDFEKEKGGPLPLRLDFSYGETEYPIVNGELQLVLEPNAFAVIEPKFSS